MFEPEEAGADSWGGRAVVEAAEREAIETRVHLKRRERGADRVVAVYIGEQREDPRAKAVLDLASRVGQPVKRVPVAQLTQWFGEVAHQGVCAEVRPLDPWGEDRLLAALGAAQAAPIPQDDTLPELDVESEQMDVVIEAMEVTQ